ncbi:VOC family protein [Brevibacillus borstelensis]|jgi:catechol 2,3-dioxygenase-like lactoylglutathione lyase family enzyme|uniref:VOC family protein n=1 Tax=Brevibacillus borstelensis TaxID=45462 RepID=UPI003D243EBA
MVRTEPIIAVNDVKASSQWYQSLLACQNSHSNGIFDQLVDTDGTILLCLHHWGDHGHPSLLSPDHGKPGNGLLLFFSWVDDFDRAWERAQSLGTKIEEEPHLNPFAGHTEFTLRDLDGYHITICSVPV